MRMKASKDDLANDINEHLTALGFGGRLKSVVKMDIEELDRLSYFLSDLIRRLDA